MSVGWAQVPSKPGALTSATRSAAESGCSPRSPNSVFARFGAPAPVLPPWAMYSRPSLPKWMALVPWLAIDLGNPVMTSVRWVSPGPDRRETTPESASPSSADGEECPAQRMTRSEEHTSELQSRPHLVCRLLLEKKKK